MSALLNLVTAPTEVEWVLLNLVLKGLFMGFLQEAMDLVHGERATDYGNMSDSFNRIGLFWSAYLGVKVDALDVAKMMILLKVSRAKHNNHRDSYVDIIGYVECASRLLKDKDEHS